MDYANISAGAAAFARGHVMSGLHYGELLEYLGEGRFVVDAYAYVPLDPRNPRGRDGDIEHMQRNGWMVITKLGKMAGESYKCNMDIEMTMDIMRHAYQVRPDILVLCSGDGDFLPLLRELRLMGIRTEVAAFHGTAARELRLQASGFIQLGQWRENERTNGIEEEAVDDWENSSSADLDAMRIPSADSYWPSA